MLGAGVEIGVACRCGAIVLPGQLSPIFVQDVLLSTISQRARWLWSATVRQAT